MIETIEIERNRYLDFFKHDIEEFKKDKNRYGVELLIETNGEDLKHPFNLIRVDFIYKDEKNVDRIISLELDSYQHYEVITKTINNARIEIFPFCWNNCRFITDKIEASILIPWVEKWIDIEDSRYSDYSNSIHNCSMVEKSDNADEITVDFGTAPIDSMTELINLLAMNNKKLVIK